MRHLASMSFVATFALASASQAVILNANPGPANNGGLTGWGMFFDLFATSNLMVTEMTTASTAAANAAFTVEVFTRTGTALGGPVASGPGSSPAGWTSLGIANATQGATASGISLAINIPDISLTANQLMGVAVIFTGAGPRYFGTGSPPYSVFNDGTLSLTTGDGRSAPFTPTGSFFSSRALVGSLTYVVPTPGAAGLFAVAGLAAARRRR